MTEVEVAQADGDQQIAGLPRWLWVAVFAGLAAWVSWRLGAFELWTTVSMPDGSSIRMPAGFATVDHPFHAVRAELLLRSLADGHPLRWIGEHQAGYPAEFYPLGATTFDLAVWTATLGQLPMMTVHKLAVIGLLLTPGIAFLWIARRDRLSPAIALIALAGQVAVRGWWWSGGSRELVEWGLFANVAAATVLLFAIPLGGALLAGSKRAAPVLGLVAALAIVSNPRSVIALVAISLGIAITWAVSRRSTSALDAIRRGAIAAAIAVLVAAPVVIPLVRFNDLYYFVHYSGYASLREYVDSSIQATGGPLFALGLLGLIWGLIRPPGFATLVAAWTLAVYVGLTAYFVVGAWPSSLIQQLETTRLMPFQRYLWLFFAGFAAVQAISLLFHTFEKSNLMTEVAGIGVAAAILVGYVVAPPSWIPEGDRGLVSVPTSAQPAIADLELAVKAADAATPAGSAMLVLGTTVSWHDQLWAPTWSDRRFFYDDWLWYWQTDQPGDYDPLTSHALRNDSSGLDRDYLDGNGIGAVIVTGNEAKPVAPTLSYLTQIRSGIYDVYLVSEPTSPITSGDIDFAMQEFDDREIIATGSSDGTPILVRHNWFPRWHATVNGESAKITKSEDGYMQIAAPAGDLRLEVDYRVEPLDWLARILCLAGLAGALALLVRPAKS